MTSLPQFLLPPKNRPLQNPGLLGRHRSHHCHRIPDPLNGVLLRTGTNNVDDQALERQFDLARQKALISESPAPATSSSGQGHVPTPHHKGVSLTEPDATVVHHTAPRSEVVPVTKSYTWPSPPSQVQVNRHAPEATFTPTAAGLRPVEGLQSNLPLDVQAIVAETVSRLLATGS